MPLTILDAATAAAVAAATNQEAQLAALVAPWAGGDVTVRTYNGATHLSTNTQGPWVIDTNATPRTATLGARNAHAAVSAGTPTRVVYRTAGGVDVFELTAGVGAGDLQFAAAIGAAGSKERISTVINAAGGLPVNALPTWLASQPLNQWFTISGTTLAGLATTSGTVPAAIFADYSGIVPVAGVRMYAFGGGHGGSNDNTVATIDLSVDTPAWSVASQPTPSAHRVVANNVTPVAIEQLWWGSAPDLQPNPPHTYNSAQWVSILNRIIWFGHRGPWTYSGELPAGFNRALQFSLDSNSWVQPGSAEDMVDPPMGRCTVQLPDGTILGSNSGTLISKYDPAAAIGARFSSWLVNGALNWNGYGSYLLDSPRNRLLRIGDLGTARYFAIDLTSKAVTDLSASLSGDAGVLAGLNARVAVDTCGACIDPVNSRVVVPTGDAGGAFYAIDLATHAVTLEAPAIVAGHTISGTPLAGSSPAGLYARIHYLPNLGGMLYAPNASAPLAFMRLN